MKIGLVMTGSLLLLLTLGVAVWAWAPDRSRAELETKYLHQASDYIEVAGIRLHVRDSGPAAAPAVMLLHGLGSSLQTWEPWARALSTEFRTIRLDLPGSGLSAPDPAGDYSDARSLKILHALMDKLDLQRATLVGNSMGGRIAWRFAAAYPQRVDKLVLISPDGFASPGFEYGKNPRVPAAVKLMKYFLPKSMLRMNLAPAYGDVARLQDETVTRYYELMLAPGSREALIARMEQSVLSEPEPLLQRIQAPTLLLWGEKDAMIPLKNSADYLRLLPHASLVSFPTLGHVPHEESPSESLPPVIRFLRQPYNQAATDGQPHASEIDGLMGQYRLRSFSGSTFPMKEHR
jgi:pimeloyl-ACP methyl ester carboxylesterase